MELFEHTFKMKTIFSLILLFSTSPVFALDQPFYPKLFFKYSWLYDENVCPKGQPLPDDEIQPEWVQEVKSKQNHFAQVWELESPAFFKVLFDRFQKGFSRKEMTATLTVCPKSSSYSNPLVIRTLNFLESFRGVGQAWSDPAFASLVFHELLHTWLVENFSFDTPLLTKYKNEPQAVLNHVHLMAIQIWVYKELGRKDLSDWIKWFYPRVRSGGEPRAWEIVNTEGYEKFIEELSK